MLGVRLEIEQAVGTKFFQLVTTGQRAIRTLLLVCTLALLYQAYHLGLTTDEPSHFAAGYAYWLGKDLLVPPDTPPLTRIISGWIPVILRAPKPDQMKRWASQDAYLIGPEIFRELKGRAHTVLFCSRLPFLAFPLLVVYLVWHWSRELFGAGTAVLLATCCVLEPTLIGHGALMKSDVAAAFGALWFAHSAWNYWRDPSVRRMAVMALSVLVAILAKFSLLPLAFLAYGLVLWRGPRMLGAVALPFFFYAGIIAASQFQAQPLPPEEVYQLPGAGVREWALPIVRLLARLPWPLQFVRGMIFVGASLHGDGFTGYMLGRTIRQARIPMYFPLALAIKFPIPLQILTIASALTSFANLYRTRVRSAEIFVWGSAALYFGTAVMSNFHIGFRHLLPALPFCIIGGGFALERWGGNRLFQAAVVVCFAWLAFSSIKMFPQGIAYFNEWVGGPRNGWKYLADSNLDWGQNLAELADYVKRNHIESIKSFVFSADLSIALGRSLPQGSLEPQDWPPPDAPPGYRFRPQPGIYAISANVLVGFLFPPGHEDYLEYFRQRRPDATAGYSILIYRVD
jgi:hypothetical protein